MPQKLGIGSDLDGIYLESAPQTKQTIDNLLSGTFGASVLASKAKDCLALVSVIFKACTNSLLLGGSDDFLTNSDFDLANSGSGFTLAVPFFCRICLKAVAFSGENPCPGEYPDDFTEFFEGVAEFCCSGVVEPFTGAFSQIFP